MEASARRLPPPLLRSRRLLSTLSDERLVREAQRGSAAAFEAIYERYHRPLLAFCRHMVGSREDAEDALQQTFASAFRALPRNEQPGNLKPWLYTIARNRSLTLVRDRREDSVEELEHRSFEGLSEEVERRAELQQILADLQALPEKQRAALVLAEVSNLTHPEVAGVLGCEAKQVKSLVFQARAALAQDREARSIPCAAIREEIANAGGRELRRSLIRRHVRTCQGCAQFERTVRHQRELLAVALPVVPSVGLRDTVLAAAGIGGGGGAAGGGGGLIAALGANSVAKLAAVAVATGGAVGGVAATDPGVFQSARIAVEQAANELAQAVSGETDRRNAAEEKAREDRAEQEASAAERAKGEHDGTAAQDGASPNSSASGSQGKHGSTDGGTGTQGTAHGNSSSATQGGSAGRGQGSHGLGSSGRGADGSAGGESGNGSNGAGGPQGGGVDPRGLFNSVPQVGGARRALPQAPGLLSH